MEKHTHREYLMWMEWLDAQWNRPSRTDNYLMLIAAEVRRVLSKKPNSIKLSHFLLKFSKAGAAPKMTKEQKTAMAKAQWFSWLGLSSKEKHNGDRN